MAAVLKVLPSRERAKCYRQLEQEALRAAATVPALYHELFMRQALKWRKLAEEAERGFKKVNAITATPYSAPMRGASLLFRFEPSRCSPPSPGIRADVKRLAIRAAEEYDAKLTKSASNFNMGAASWVRRPSITKQRPPRAGGGGRANKPRFLSSAWKHVTDGKEYMNTTSRMTMVLMIFSYALAH